MWSLKTLGKRTSAEAEAHSNSRTARWKSVLLIMVGLGVQGEVSGGFRLTMQGNLHAMSKDLAITGDK
jgi:hypothetical protein